MRVVAWDTWAFVEIALELPRHAEVRALVGQDPVIVTSRDVVVETVNFLVGRTGGTDVGLAWWRDLRDSRVRVVDDALEDLAAFADERAPEGAGLSLTDLSLAKAAMDAGADEIATEDGGFRRLGLEPLFAR